MKKTILILATFLALMLGSVTFVPPLASASSTNYIPACSNSTTDTNGVTTGGEAQGSSICSDATASSQSIVVRLISDVIDIMSFIVGVAAIIIIIVSAIRLITGGSEPNTAAEAKRGIIGAVVGLLVVAIAQAIVIFVLDNIK